MTFTIRLSILIFFILILLFVMFYDYIERYFYRVFKKSSVLETRGVQKIDSVPVIKSNKPTSVVTPLSEVTPLVLSKPKPSIQSKPVLEENEDEVDMETTVFFSEKIIENKSFYQSLKGKNKTDFDQLFVLAGPKHVVPTLNYVVGGDNHIFFTDLFKYIFKYRRLISLELLNILLHEMLSLTKDPLSMTLLYEVYIRVAYARRQSIEFLKEAKRVCELDVALHYDVLKTKGKFVYSFVRLAIILEKEKNITKALEVVNKAILRDLDDNNATKFESRRARLQSKKYN